MRRGISPLICGTIIIYLATLCAAKAGAFPRLTAVHAFGHVRLQFALTYHIGKAFLAVVFITVAIALTLHTTLHGGIIPRSTASISLPYDRFSLGGA